MDRKRIRIVIAACAAAVCVILFLALRGGKRNAQGGGTGAQAPVSEAVREQEPESTVPYTAEQMLFILLSQKERTEKLLTDSIWDVKLPGRGEAYGEVFQNEMKEFFRELYIMDRLAESRSVRLTTEEQRRMEVLGGEYYDEYLKGKRIFDRLTREQTIEMFTAYYTADRLRREMMSDRAAEVSDSEARVVDLQILVTSDAEKMQQAFLSAREGADFQNLIRTCSEVQGGIVKIPRGTLPEAVEKAAFQMEDGEVSDIIGDGGSLYLIRCVSSYDREETAARKKELEKERLSEVVRGSVGEWAAVHRVTLPDSTWEAVMKNADISFSGADFFSFLEEGMSDESL